MSKEASLTAPEEKPEWLLRCLAEVKEELRRDLLSSMTDSTLRIKLKGPKDLPKTPVRAKDELSESPAMEHLAAALQSGALKLHKGYGASSSPPREGRERVRKEVGAYERHCVHGQCLHGSLGLHDGARHPILLLPKQMPEDAKRELLAAVAAVHGPTTFSPRPEAPASSGTSTPSTRPDLWSVPPPTADSDSGDDFSLIADDELGDFEMPAHEASPDEAQLDDDVQDMDQVLDQEPTKEEAQKEQAEISPEEEEAERREVEAAAEVRETQALAEMETAMARLRKDVTETGSQVQSESMVMVERPSQTTTPPPSMESSITASQYVASHRLIDQPATAPPPAPSVAPELYYSLHEDQAGLTDQPADPTLGGTSAETEVKRPLAEAKAEAKAEADKEAKKEKRVSRSESLDAVLGSVLAAASGAVGVAERTVTRTVEVVGSTLDSALTSASKATGRKWEPPEAQRKWTPPAQAWVPSGTQTSWVPPPGWAPPKPQREAQAPEAAPAPATGDATVEPRFMEAMDTLVAMGFADVEKNAALIRIHGNNLASIVDTLLTDFNVVPQ